LFDPTTNEYLSSKAAANHAATVVQAFGCRRQSDWREVCQWLPQTQQLHHALDFPTFTHAEVMQVLQALPSKKTSGPDQVPAWITRYLPTDIHTFLTHFPSVQAST
jgi:hypothetical protein